MTRIADEAKQYWSASLFWRRAPHRDQKTAVRIIRSLTKSPIPRIAALARSMMEEIREPSRKN